jgi:AcrR family transcriptional regulator
MRSEERSRQILTCAKRVFAERGFHAANISDICAAAGIGRGTLYQYFANKRAVMTSILREALGRVRDLMELQLTIALPPPERLTREGAITFSAQQLASVLAVVFEDGDSFRILLREAVGLDVEIEQLLAEIDDAMIGIVERDLIRAHAAGYLRDIDTRAVATMIVGGIEKLGLAALRGDAPVDLGALALEATKLHAIGTLSHRIRPQEEES